MSRPRVEFTLEAFTKAEWWVWQAYQDYQKVSDDLDIIKEHSKDMLAKIMSDIENTDPSVKLSEAKLERLARASTVWAEFKKGYAAAIQLHGEAKVKYYSAVRFFDCIQSGLAYRRTEMQRIN